MILTFLFKFEQTNGANTKEARELISTFRKILQRTEVENDPNVEPVKIAVTGAAGSIGYAILLRIASGDLLGKDVPVQLHLLEVPEALTSLEGVVMELNDCAFPLLRGVKTFSNPEEAFEDVDFALLVGAQPRTKGMERKDLLMKNGDIFTVQGRALDKSAKKSVKVVVVGNPANTNCLIASNNAPSIPVENFSAMTRLDHNRGLSQLTQKLNISLSDIENFAIWGNHSSTQFPSIEHCLINGKPARKVINDDEWILKTFIPVVQNRGAEIIKVRGASSAASAGSAAIDHIHDWVLGTNGEWTSMGVYSNGDYGVTPGLFYSYPVLTSKGEYEIVQDLQLDPFTAEKLELTHQELLQERDSVSSLLKL